MGKTNTQRFKSRQARLEGLPKKARAAVNAAIKKKSGRVLNATEKHVVKMRGEHGHIVRAWEVLRASNERVEEKIAIMRQQERDAAATAAALSGKKGADTVEDDTEGALATSLISTSDIDTATGDRTAAVSKLLSLIEPKFLELIRTPKVSRVVQSCVKWGSTEQREHILSFLKSEYVNTCQDAFGHFVVIALFRHANTALYNALYELTQPVVNTLISHKHGMQVLHACYSSRYTNVAEKHQLVLGVFKDSVAIMRRWKGYPILEDILTHLPDDERKRLSSKLFNLVDKLVSKKEALGLPFVQRLVCCALWRGEQSEVQELASSVREFLVDCAQTKEGAPLASLVVSHVPLKERKPVLSAVKTDFVEVITSKHGAPFVARLCDLTYDPQLANKYLVEPIKTHFDAIIASPFGFRVLLHLCTPERSRRSTIFFPNWHDPSHNLYERENMSWNKVQWSNIDGKLSEVEIASHDAEKAHQVIISGLWPTLLPFFLKCQRTSGVVQKSTIAFVTRLVAEILHLRDVCEAFKSVTPLSNDELAALQFVQAKKVRIKEEQELKTEEAERDENQHVPRPTAGMQTPMDLSMNVSPVSTRPTAMGATPRRSAALKRTRSSTVNAETHASPGSTGKKNSVKKDHSNATEVINISSSAAASPASGKRASVATRASGASPAGKQQPQRLSTVVGATPTPVSTSGGPKTPPGSKTKTTPAQRSSHGSHQKADSSSNKKLFQ